MGVVPCPHCGKMRIMTAKVPKDVVVVLPCPDCGELVVMFRHKILAINRGILEGGTLEEKKEHIAEVIAQFLEPGMFTKEEFESLGGLSAADRSDAEEDRGKGSERKISDEELERFIAVDLKLIDDDAYFRKHFGQK